MQQPQQSGGDRTLTREQLLALLRDAIHEASDDTVSRTHSNYQEHAMLLTHEAMHAHCLQVKAFYTKFLTEIGAKCIRADGSYIWGANFDICCQSCLLALGDLTR